MYKCKSCGEKFKTTTSLAQHARWKCTKKGKVVPAAPITPTTHQAIKQYAIRDLLTMVDSLDPAQINQQLQELDKQRDSLSILLKVAEARNGNVSKPTIPAAGATVGDG